MASVRLSLVTDMAVIAMFTEQLRDLLKAIMARGLLNLVMDTAQEPVTTTEVPRKFTDMVMEVITRDLLILDTTMVMGNLMSTKAVITIMDLMDMRLNMSIKRDLPKLDMDMEVKATIMSTDLTLTTRLRFTTLKPTTMDMEGGLLSLDMALLMSMLSKRIMVMDTQNLMNMATTSTRDPLKLDMATAVKAISMLTDLILTTRSRFTILKATTMDMERGLLNLDMALLMSMWSKRIMVMDTQNLMNMATTSTRDLLKLDMNPMKVTKMFQTPHTHTMRSKCTTLTKHQIENVPQFSFLAINSQ